MDTWMRLMANDGSIVFGRVENGYLHEYEGLDQPVPTGAVLSLRTLTPLAPCAPGKVIALWNNFHALAAKLEKPVPSHPLFLIKPAESVIGSDVPILRPAHYAGKIVFEGELGIVIGKRCRNASEEEAEAAIFGYTIVNDVTARDVQMRHQQWDMGKSFDTFCPMGPWIVTGDELDGTKTRVRCWVNGEQRQDGPTENMIFDIPTLIETISRGITLYPGDVIATGTPAGVGMGSGDVIRIEIDGIGRIENKFV